MDTVSSTLQTAMKLHHAGEIDRAESLYRDVIEEEPANSDARHLLGVAAHQRGDHERVSASSARATCTDVA